MAEALIAGGLMLMLGSAGVMLMLGIITMGALDMAAIMDGCALGVGAALVATAELISGISGALEAAGAVELFPGATTGTVAVLATPVPSCSTSLAKSCGSGALHALTRHTDREPRVRTERRSILIAFAFLQGRILLPPLNLDAAVEAPGK
jgi:hypothetical protein